MSLVTNVEPIDIITTFRLAIDFLLSFCRVLKANRPEFMAQFDGIFSGSTRLAVGSRGN